MYIILSILIIISCSCSREQDIDVYTPSISSEVVISSGVSSYISLTGSDPYILGDMMYTGAQSVRDVIPEDIPRGWEGYNEKEFKDFLSRYIAKVDRESVDNIFKIYDYFLDHHPDFRLQCHQIAHSVGHEVVERFGFRDSISFIPYDTCTGGFIHGVVEQAVLIDDTLRTHPESICSDITDRLTQGNCIHGVGHGLMFVESYDVETSLERCQVFYDNNDKIYCRQGVFMEYFIGDRTHVIDQKRMTRTEPRELCREMYASGKVLGDTCSFYLPQRYTSERRVSEIDRDIYEYCEPLGSDSSRCIYGASRILGWVYSETPRTLEDICMSLTETQKIQCFQGIVDHLLFRHESVDTVRKFCDTMSQSGSMSCTFALESSRFLYSPDDLFGGR